MAAGGAVTYPTGLAGLRAGQSVINVSNISFDSTIPQTLDCTAKHSGSGNSPVTNIATIELLPQVAV